MSDLLGHDFGSPRKSASHGEAGYARAARDAYFTDPWVTRSLVDALELGFPSRGETLVWEPAVGDGRMADVLRAAGYSVFGSDVHDYGWSGTYLIDFLKEANPFSAVDAIVTNPPFDLAKQFIARAVKAVERTKGKVCIVQRHEFDAPKTNRPLFCELPFSQKLVLPKRPRWVDDDKASPRFPYAWYVWDWRHEGSPVIRWI